jgi:hypothetical protein
LKNRKNRSKIESFDQLSTIITNFVALLKPKKMKKVVYLLGIMLLMMGVAKAQDTQTQLGPEIEFEKVVHDYGNIPYNGNGECEFRFTNTGTEPLLIQKPKSSCGCTIPSWPNEPILPGESEVIKVTYKTNRVGNINKTVTVTSNAVKNSTVVLRIKGTVMEQPTEAMPEKKNDMGTPVNNN